MWTTASLALSKCERHEVTNRKKHTISIQRTVWHWRGYKNHCTKNMSAVCNRVLWLRDQLVLKLSWSEEAYGSSWKPEREWSRVNWCRKMKGLRSPVCLFDDRMVIFRLRRPMMQRPRSPPVPCSVDTPVSIPTCFCAVHGDWKWQSLSEFQSNNSVWTEKIATRAIID